MNTGEREAHCVFCEDPNFTFHDCVVAAATQMRPSNNQDYEYGFDYALDRVEQELESLTLDVEQKEAK